MIVSITGVGRAGIEVKFSYDIIFMFCDVLLYHMHVKYLKSR